eukprot:g1310.t1
MKLPNISNSNNRLKTLALIDVNVVTKGQEELSGKNYDLYLEGLETLILTECGINGAIPEKWKFNSLEILNFNDNELDGKIPSRFFIRNKKLHTFFAHKNEKLFGVLPTLSNHSSLKCVDVRDTKVASPLPYSYLSIIDGELFLPASSFNISEIKSDIVKYNYNQMKCQICSCKMERDPTRNMDRCYDLCDDGKVYDRKYLYRISNPITKFSPYIWCSSFADPKGTCKSTTRYGVRYDL